MEVQKRGVTEKKAFQVGRKEALAVAWVAQPEKRASVDEGNQQGLLR